MAEYISRDWLLTHTHTGMDTIQMMQTMIDAPAADVVEVMHGRWILNTVRDEWQQFHSDPECSECGFHPYYYHDHSVMKYCPNCGARMDWVENGRV